MGGILHGLNSKRELEVVDTTNLGREDSYIAS